MKQALLKVGETQSQSSFHNDFAVIYLKKNEMAGQEPLEYSKIRVLLLKFSKVYQNFILWQPIPITHIKSSNLCTCTFVP